MRCPVSAPTPKRGKGRRKVLEKTFRVCLPPLSSLFHLITVCSYGSFETSKTGYNLPGVIVMPSFPLACQGTSNLLRVLNDHGCSALRIAAAR